MFQSHGRFYEPEFPEVDDNVVVQIQRIDDKSGAYVTLLEYDNKEGMINLSEISKRRIRSMLKILRVGSTEVCTVVSVDEEKGYINLSKKRVAAEDIAPKQDFYAKAKAVHGIMQHVAAINQIPVEELCQKISWPLHKKHVSAFDALKQHINKETDIWAEIDFSQPGEDLSSVAEKLKQDVETNLQRKLVQSMVRLQAKCEVSCSEYEGIDAIKESLMEGLKASQGDIEVVIKLVAHPMFALTTMCKEKNEGIQVLEEALSLIETAIRSRGGDFLIKSRPEMTLKEEAQPKESDGSASGDEDSEESHDEAMAIGEDLEKRMKEMEDEVMWLAERSAPPEL